MKFTQDFLEKFIILILTAALTSFLIPYILKRVDERKARDHSAGETPVPRLLNHLSPPKLRRRAAAAPPAGRPLCVPFKPSSAL